MIQIYWKYLAMAQRLNKPPVLEYEDHYAKRKNDLDVWQLYGDLNKKKRGPAVYLTLSGRARECISTWKTSLKFESTPTLCRSAFLPADTTITRRVAATIEVASSVVHILTD